MKIDNLFKIYKCRGRLSIYRVKQQFKRFTISLKHESPHLLNACTVQAKRSAKLLMLSSLVPTQLGRPIYLCSLLDFYGILPELSLWMAVPGSKISWQKISQQSPWLVCRDFEAEARTLDRKKESKKDFIKTRQIVTTSPWGTQIF